MIRVSAQARYECEQTLTPGGRLAVRGFRVARAAFLVDRLFEVLHDAALGAAAVVRMAALAQRPQLLFEQAHRLDLLVDARDLAVDQLIHFVAGLARVGLEAPQRADIGEADAERAAMADEVQLRGVRARVAAVSVGFALRLVQQAFAFVKAHRFDVAMREARQFADSHGRSSPKMP
ncbi:hypothetical protein PSAC2689_140126 [Paraburkholderia sacchari]